jgi:hypothetical protein
MEHDEPEASAADRLRSRRRSDMLTQRTVIAPLSGIVADGPALRQ